MEEKFYLQKTLFINVEMKWNYKYHKWYTSSLGQKSFLESKWNQVGQKVQPLYTKSSMWARK